jgi:hypothetical protein
VSQHDITKPWMQEKRTVGYMLTDYGPLDFGNRPVRTRTLGGVGVGGEKPPATQFGPLFVVLLVSLNFTA